MTGIERGESSSIWPVFNDWHMGTSPSTNGLERESRILGTPDCPQFCGGSLMDLVTGKRPNFESSPYLTECAWMRKHWCRPAAVEIDPRTGA